MTKITGKNKPTKYLLFYEYRLGDIIKKDWLVIHLTTPGGDYKSACIRLRQQVNRYEKTKGREILRVIHVYNTL